MQPTEYRVSCRVCRGAFQASRPTFRYCDNCRSRKCKNCGKDWKIAEMRGKRSQDFCGSLCASSHTMRQNWSDPNFQKKTRERGRTTGQRLAERNGQGATHPRWKGDEVGYRGIHSWVRRQKGPANKCDADDCEGRSNTYHWSNISGEYKRDLSDWQQRCVPCHSAFDRTRV